MRCHLLIKGFLSCHFKYDDYCYTVSLCWHTITLIKAKQSHTIITVHLNSWGMSANKDIRILDKESGRTLSGQCVAVVNASISLSVDTCQLWFQTMSKAPVVYWASNFAIITQYWLVPGKDMNMIQRSKMACFTIKLK